MGTIAKLPIQFIQTAKDRTDTATVVIGAFLGLAWATVVLRFGVRGLLIKSLGRDDWAMLITMFIYTAYCAVALQMNSYNPELMLGQIPESEYVDVFNYLQASIALYIWTTVVFKIALGLFFLRIMVDRWQRYTIYGTVGFATVYGTAFFFFSLFQCGNPINFVENQILGKCVSNQALLAVNLTAGIINAVADWILALLLVFLLRKAQMPLPAKITAGCLMALGALGSISSIVRLTFLWSFKPGPNFFWTSIKLTMWSIIECGVCIAAGSLATLRPLFHCCMENARAMTPGLTGGSFGGSTVKDSRSTGTDSTARSHRKHDSFVPLSDLVSWQDPQLADHQKTPRLQIRHQGTGSFIVGSSSSPQRYGAPREDPVRQEAARKAKALELSRIATEKSPGTSMLHGNRAEQFCESPVDPHHPSMPRYQESRFDWV